MKIKAFFVLSLAVLLSVSHSQGASARTREVRDYVQEIRDCSVQAMNAHSVEEARYFAGQAVVAADNAVLQAHQDGLDIPAVFLNDVYAYSKEAEQADTLEDLQDDARQVIAAAEAIQFSLQRGYLRN